MTPQEQAKNLINKFSPLMQLWDYRNDEPMPEKFVVEDAKKCALICVESHMYSENNSPFDTMAEWKEDDKFWNEVKQILNNK